MILAYLRIRSVGMLSNIIVTACKALTSVVMVVRLRETLVSTCPNIEETTSRVICTRDVRSPKLLLILSTGKVVKEKNQKGKNIM